MISRLLIYQVGVEMPGHLKRFYLHAHLIRMSTYYVLTFISKCYHKLINRQLTGYFTCFHITPATEIHQHSTRAASKLFITRANHEFANKYLRHSIIVTVNNTITSITNKTHTHSLDGFAKYVKKSIIQSYESNCIINNCYLCPSLDP